MAGVPDLYRLWGGSLEASQSPWLQGAAEGRRARSWGGGPGGDRAPLPPPGAPTPLPAACLPVVAGGHRPDAGPVAGNSSAEPPGSPTPPEQGCAWSPRPEGGEEPLRLPTFSPAAQARVAVTFALFALSAGCNLAVLRAAGGRGGARRSHIRLLLRHLAAADLLVTVAVMPLDAVWNVTVQWYGGELSCKLLNFLKLFAMYAAALVLVVISLDRHAAVLRPFARARRRNGLLLRAAWAGSVLLAAPQVGLGACPVGFGFGEGLHQQVCPSLWVSPPPAWLW